ncbi:hypothetical protein LJB71_02105 [Thermomonas sp. S9]|uniref:hypothetical protein n=1 Tax=Thermomonas sp. S9 TaxID=2885203 RepID=UPI00216B2299|nr:hypothetical protein [Thermomonas sp. S9]MCR6495155.1 hypothetical protein [Thermomonas sp. S9]
MQHLTTRTLAGGRAILYCGDSLALLQAGALPEWDALVSDPPMASDSSTAEAGKDGRDVWPRRIGSSATMIRSTRGRGRRRPVTGRWCCSVPTTTRPGCPRAGASCAGTRAAGMARRRVDYRGNGLNIVRTASRMIEVDTLRSMVARGEAVVLDGKL